MKFKRNMSPKSYAVYIFIACVVLFFGAIFYEEEPSSSVVRNLSYSEFRINLEKGSFKTAEINGQSVSGKCVDGSSYKATIVPTESLMDEMIKQGVNVKVATQDSGDGSIWSTLISIIFMLLLIFFIYTRLMNGSMGGSSKMFSVGKSKAQFFEPGEVKTKFKDVAGLEEAKEDLEDIIYFLKNPEKYKALGAKIPRGVLLCGEPGNGKTLLAKAVAGEAHCGFFAMSGSDFIEMYVGVGAARVRDLFIQARKSAPCILFIDEIDAIGKQRSNGLGGGGQDERDQTLNQLLAELDGFATEPGAVIVLAATNRPDILDKALVRPGRFDRNVVVSYPDIKARIKLLEIHSRKVPLADDVDFEKIGRGTPGMSGAELASLINEAALRATRFNRKLVEMDDFEEARDRLRVGAARKNLVQSEKIRKETAIHEAGHALLSVLLEDALIFHKVTILPRGNTLGISWSLLSPDDELQQTKKQSIARIKVSFGGMIAELIKMGTTTAGVSSDLQNATQIARSMAIYWGMASTGPMSLSVGFDGLAPATKEKLDLAVEEILRKAYAEAEELIKANIHLLDKLADELFKAETLNAGQVYELLGLTPREDLSFVKKEQKVLSAEPSFEQQVLDS